MIAPSETAVLDLSPHAGGMAPHVAEPPAPEATAETHRWFVVYSKPHREGMAEFHLERRGIEVFLPKLRLPDYVQRKRQVVPLFPNYLFVRIDPFRDFYTVLWTPGVKRFVTSKTGPTALDEPTVAFLMRQAGEGGVVNARADLRVGQRVEITDGPFDGLMGIIQRPPDAKGRVKVLMELLNRRGVRVQVPMQFLKTAWVV